MTQRLVTKEELIKAIGEQLDDSLNNVESCSVRRGLGGYYEAWIIVDDKKQGLSD